MRRTKTILIVADDAEKCGLLKQTIEAAAFDVIGPLTALEALRHCRSQFPRAALVHSDLANITGPEFCLVMRARAAEADLKLILFATDDRPRPLKPRDGHADAYLSAAQHRHVIRHLIPEPDGRPSSSKPALTIEYDGVHLAARFDRVRVAVDGVPVDLRPRELRLLQLLVSNPGLVLTRKDILNWAWDGENDGLSRTVDVHIRRLRAVLGPAANHIQTVIGVGYRFSERLAVAVAFASAAF